MANFIIKEKYSNILLLLASLFFYAWGEPILVLLMIVTILVNWILGRVLIKQEGIRKKIVLVVALIFDLGIIGYYKYFGFLVSIINSILGSEAIADPEIRLPIGISFFTFQAISYMI
ncbi:MAG: MBOAT family protein, partial [Lachnospiraceae bacterium]|nr:MBOAT family protein [Lachnospiraceae bacterium]